MLILSCLQDLSNIFSIAIPIVLLIWFLYSRYQTLKLNYLDDLKGTYAGYVYSSRNHPDTKNLKSGIILNLREVDDKGFFKGDFKYREIEIKGAHPPSSRDIRSQGIHTFFGKIKYKLSFKYRLHPLKPKKNRNYKGYLFVIVRFDFPIETNEMEDYLKAKYSIKNYREMGILKFKLSESIKEHAQKLPTEFTLYKSEGYAFEPLTGVKSTVFMEF